MGLGSSLIDHSLCASQTGHLQQIMIKEGWQALHGWCWSRFSKPMKRVEEFCLVGSTPIVCRHFLSVICSE